MFLSVRSSLYARLLRLHQPAGIWLLLLPCWWGIAFASPGGLPDFSLLLRFALGSVFMRSAGCVINDIIDRDIDARVTRTKDRPLANGSVSMREALLILALLLGASSLILFSLKPLAIMLGVAALAPVILYPFMKRFTFWPQAFLGLTFNWGTLMGWVAVTGALEPGAFLLYAAGIFWTLGYDTIYAHQDKESDALIGVKSTALKLGHNTKYWVSGFYGITSLCMLASGLLLSLSWPFYIGWAIGTLQLIWQVNRVKLDTPDSCMHIFRTNSYYGWIIFFAVICSQLLTG